MAKPLARAGGGVMGEGFTGVSPLGASPLIENKGNSFIHSRLHLFVMENDQFGTLGLVAKLAQARGSHGVFTALGGREAGFPSRPAESG